MDRQIARLKKLCDEAQNPEWNEEMQRVVGATAAQIAFVSAHRPGLIRALWSHFEATSDKCGCSNVSHENPDCSVRLIQKLLLEEELH